MNYQQSMYLKLYCKNVDEYYSFRHILQVLKKIKKTKFSFGEKMEDLFHKYIISNKIDKNDY